MGEVSNGPGPADQPPGAQAQLGPSAVAVPSRSRMVRGLLFLARTPLLLLVFGAIMTAFWIFSELIGDARMTQTTGIVIEASESVFPGGPPISPPGTDVGPCRYPSGTAFFSTNSWFVVEHEEGVVLFCSGFGEVGTEINLWVHPDNPTDGRIRRPTFTVLGAVLWLVGTLLVGGALTWGWVTMRAWAKR